MADVQRSRRIGRDKFDQHLALRAGIIPAVIACFGENAPDLGVIGRRTAEEIHETRSGNIDLVDLIGLRERGDQSLGQLARLPARDFGQQQGCIAGKIAVLATARALDHERRGRIRGQYSVGLQPGDRLQDNAAELIFHAGNLSERWPL